MLTTQDINQIIKALKELFYTKPEIDDKLSKIGTKLSKIDGKLSKLQNTMDGIAGDKLKDDDERTVLAYRMKNAEDWIDKAAPKVGVQFEH